MGSDLFVVVFVELYLSIQMVVSRETEGFCYYFDGIVMSYWAYFSQWHDTQAEIGKYGEISLVKL